MVYYIGLVAVIVFILWQMFLSIRDSLRAADIYNYTHPDFAMGIRVGAIVEGMIWTGIIGFIIGLGFMRVGC